MACNPEELAEAAKCFECLNDQQSQAVELYLLALIAGASPDPGALVELAKEFQGLNPQQSSSVEAYLLCQISGG